MNLLKSRSAYALDGPTDQYLIEPWVRHLEDRGVVFHRSTAVRSLAAEGGSVTVRCESGDRGFDVVLVTAFVPDAIALLEASGVPHSLRQLNHIHCLCMTVELNPAEPILDRSGPGIYCRDGINVLVQPQADRCLVLCTNSVSTNQGWVLDRVRQMLSLEHEVVAVRARDNQGLEEAVYCADYANAEEIAPASLPGVHFAGSYVRNSYPLDSGEGAARSAWDAVQRIRREPRPASSAPEPDMAKA